MANVYSSFKPNNFHVPKAVNRDELPMGRPLWQRDICKVVPAPDIYNISREMGKKPNKNQDCTFGTGFGAYQKTCDINNCINRNDIRIYDYAVNNDIKKCHVSQTKKQVPTFSFTKGKQNVLWNEERKRAYVTPGPSSYNAAQDKILQQTKFQCKRAMGYDTKCNQKNIRIAPGPADYHTTNELFIKSSHNYCYNSGGLKKPDTITPKEELIIKYFGGKGLNRQGSTTSNKKNQTFFAQYQQRDNNKQVPVGSDLKFNQQRVSSQQMKQRLYSPIAKPINSFNKTPYQGIQPGGKTPIQKKYNTLVSSTPNSGNDVTRNGNQSLNALKQNYNQNLSSNNMIGQYPPPVTLSQQMHHITPTEILLKTNKAPGRKTYTAIGQRKKSGHFKGSKKSVTAMSASKVSQAASTTNPGYDSENFAQTASNFNQRGVPNKELFSGGYQTQDNASGYYSGDVMGGDLVDGFDSSVKMGQPPRWIQTQHMNQTMDMSGPNGMRVFQNGKGMPSVALRMSHQPVSIDKNYGSKKFIRARSVNRFELRENKSGDLNQLDHTNFI